jgi:hypothetical protein
LNLTEKVFTKKILNISKVLNVNVPKMMNVRSGKFEAFLKFLQFRNKKCGNLSYAGYVVSSNSVLSTCGTVRFLYDGVTV